MGREKREAPTMQAQNTLRAKWAGMFGLTRQEWHQMTWNALNFTTVAAITSGSIALVQSPARTALAHLSMNGTFMPPGTTPNIGFLSIVRTLYAGTTMSLKGSAVRTAYVTGVKGNKPVEGLSEEAASLIREEELIQEGRAKQLSKQKMGFVVSATLGDMFVTQVPGTYTTLRKIPGLLPENFKFTKPANILQAMKAGFLPAYLAGLTNYTSLLVIEPYIARNLRIQDKKAQHFVAGAISGSMAAFFAYPFAVACDYTVVRTTVNSEGRLSTRSTLSIAQEIINTVKSNPKQAMYSFFGNAAKQLPIRMGLTAMIYSIVSGVGETLGTEPLKAIVPERFQPGNNSQGFFAKPPVTEEGSSVGNTQVPPQETPKGP
ncbi:Uncharacterised protein [Legionella donaldsonii]|uniref:Periplasmic ligand-binding sensor domain protein n=1 Tax=Legionella donaldsonii TaxID=45060 RepID=A0A378JBI3_9GAMM|nr:hypothetical protein [Legionella donaldsonii]STX44809.1 Uncharacterised protein [Legionella donaldsonii]